MLISRLERLGLGVLTRSCPPELVDLLVNEAGRLEKRRRLLSARFTVYFVLAICLFSQADYLEVLRLVKSGDPGLLDQGEQVLTDQGAAAAGLDGDAGTVPDRGPAAGQGRRSLPRLRVLAQDGTLLAVPDSAVNNDAFGKSGSQRSPIGYPQARVVAVVECSSHAVLDAVAGGSRNLSGSSPTPWMPMSGAGRCCWPTADCGVWPVGTGCGTRALTFCGGLSVARPGESRTCCPTAVAWPGSKPTSTARRPGRSRPHPSWSE
ncbi:transposase domain-containing protein [Streptomyces sp. CoH17]|uniref:transposase domain-containing protein n=1 Tax=Streptomyces sp. CoH17 TaxID=2992806 RepID=UPI002D1E4991|nr:transposase domain-containing protein [Streptomyces sp. CoH17]